MFLLDFPGIEPDIIDLGGWYPKLYTTTACQRPLLFWHYDGFFSKVIQYSEICCHFSTFDMIYKMPYFHLNFLNSIPHMYNQMMSIYENVSTILRCTHNSSRYIFFTNYQTKFFSMKSFDGLLKNDVYQNLGYLSLVEKLMFMAVSKIHLLSKTMDENNKSLSLWLQFFSRFIGYFYFVQKYSFSGEFRLQGCTVAAAMIDVISD